MSFTPESKDRPLKWTPLTPSQQEMERELVSQMYSIEAEKGVLGLMMAFPDKCVELVGQALTVTDFHVPQHQTLFRVVCDMYREKVPIDVTTAHLWVMERKLDTFEGQLLILIGECLGAYVPESYLPHYVKIVEDKAMARAMHQQCVRTMTDLANNLDDVDGVFDRAEKGILSVTRSFKAVPVADAWKTQDLTDFLATQRELPKPLQLVENFIEQGTKVVFGGASKSKKTWSMLDLGLSVAFGKKFWGMNTARMKVLHLDFELQPKALAERIEAVARAKGIVVEPGWVFPMSLRGQLRDPDEALRKIKRVALEMGAGLITIDPMYKFNAGKDENAAGDIAMLMNKLEDVVVATGATILVANHFSKGNQAAKDPMDRIAGSGVWARDADTLFVMTAHEEDDCLTVSPVLRNFKEIPEFVVRWNFPLMELATELDPSKLRKPPSGFQSKYSLEQVLRVIGAKIMTAREVEQACLAEYEMSDSAVKRFLKKGKSAGKLTQPTVGLWQRATVGGS